MKNMFVYVALGHIYNMCKKMVFREEGYEDKKNFKDATAFI